MEVAITAHKDEDCNLSSLYDMLTTPSPPFPLSSSSADDLEREVIDVGERISGWYGREVFAKVIKGLFTEEECKAFIHASESAGFEAATVSTGGSQVHMSDYRSSDRCIIDSITVANAIYSRVAPYLPREYKGLHIVESQGVNERLRFLRYDGGGYFKPHFDGVYTRSNGEKSLITIQIYLNGSGSGGLEGFEGGSTTFMDPYARDDEALTNPNPNPTTRVEVVPTPGQVLLFEHRLMHEGSEVLSGRKYCIRSDIMYAKEGGETPSPPPPPRPTKGGGGGRNHLDLSKEEGEGPNNYCSVF